MAVVTGATVVVAAVVAAVAAAVVAAGAAVVVPAVVVAAVVTSSFPRGLQDEATSKTETRIANIKTKRSERFIGLSLAFFFLTVYPFPVGLSRVGIDFFYQTWYNPHKTLR